VKETTTMVVSFTQLTHTTEQQQQQQTKKVSTNFKTLKSTFIKKTVETFKISLFVFDTEVY
jgi:hypothetical protein